MYYLPRINDYRSYKSIPPQRMKRQMNTRSRRSIWDETLYSKGVAEETAQRKETAQRTIRRMNTRSSMEWNLKQRKKRKKRRMNKRNGVPIEEANIHKQYVTCVAMCCVMHKISPYDWLPPLPPRKGKNQSQWLLRLYRYSLSSVGGLLVSSSLVWNTAN